MADNGALSAPVGARNSRSTVLRVWAQIRGAWRTLGLRAQVNSLQLRTGPAPAEMVVEIPVTPNATAERSNALAFAPGVVDGGFGSLDLRVGTRIYCERISGGKSTVVWAGSVTQITRDKGGAVILLCQDDRWLLQEIRVIGRWVCAYDDPMTEHYQQGWPCWFNPGGLPNMVFSSEYLFTPYPEWKLATDTQPGGNTVADYWTLAGMMDYLRKSYAVEETSRTYTAYFPFVRKTPSSVVWPANLGAGLDADARAWFDQGRGQKQAAVGTGRKGRDINLEGMGLLDAMELLLSTAGGYTLDLAYEAAEDSNKTKQVKSTLKIVKSAYKSEGISLPLAHGGSIGQAITAPCVTRGQLVEDGTGVLTDFTVAGGLCFQERRMSERGIDHGAAEATVGLQPRWTAARLAELCADGKANAVSTAEGMRKLFEKYQEVLAYYQINPAFNFTMPDSNDLGTELKWGNWPRAKLVRPILQHLLSWRGANAADYAAMRYAIRVEIYKDSAWQPTPDEFDGLQTFDDGTISLAKLRDWVLSTLTGNWKWAGAEYNFDAGITALPIRLTVAIPHDHRVFGSASIRKDLWPEGAPQVPQLLVSPDTDRIEPTLSRGGYAQVEQLYHHWERYRSWPTPASIYSADMAANKVKASALRDDLTLAREHAVRRLYQEGRLKRGGVLYLDGQLTLAYKPGQEIEDLALVEGALAANEARQTLPARCVVREVRWQTAPVDGQGPARQWTELHLG